MPSDPTTQVPAKVAVWPVRGVIGWAGLIDDNGVPYSVTKTGQVVRPSHYRCVPLLEALSAEYTTDAHATGYRVREDSTDLNTSSSDQPAYEPQQPRLKKAAVMVHELAGQPIELTVVWIDIDTTPHTPWVNGPAGPEATWHVERIAHLCPYAAAYATRSGLRLVWQLSEAIPQPYADAWLHAWFEVLKERGVGSPTDIDLDTNTLQWTRCYRLPITARDGLAPVRPAMYLDPIAQGLYLDPAAAVEWGTDRALWPTAKPTPQGYSEAAAKHMLAAGVHWPDESTRDDPDSAVQIYHWVMAASSKYGATYSANLENGRPWAEHGSRDATMVKIIGSLAMTLRDEATPQRLYWMMLPSLEAMQAAPTPTKISRAKLWQKCVEYTAVEAGRRAAERAALQAPHTAPTHTTLEVDAPASDPDIGATKPTPTHADPLDTTLPSDTMWMRHTDTGNAERLTVMFGRDIRHVEEWGAWLAFDGKRWAKGSGGRMLGLSKVVARHIRAEATALEAPAEVDQEWRERRNKYAKSAREHAKKSESGGARKAMLAMAVGEPGLEISATDLDQQPMLFNVPNGTIDLATGCLKPHNRGDLMAQMCEIEYQPMAKCPTWDAFVLDVMSGDAEMVQYLYRALGYSMSGMQTEQVLFFCYGAGSNGKGTLLNTVFDILGDYSTGTAPDMLLKSRNEAHPEHIARLHRKRLALVSEIEEGRRFDEPKLKRLTGGDVITAREMHEASFDFHPTHHFWVQTNDKPTIAGTDHSMWRRMQLLPFDQSYVDADMIAADPKRFAGAKPKDTTLPHRLRAEAPGILARLVQGCLDWQAVGLAPPRKVADAVERYRAAQDVLGDFIDDRCVEDNQARIKISVLYPAYCSWAESNGLRPWSKRAFGHKLDKKRFEALKSGSWYRLGLKLKGTK